MKVKKFIQLSQSLRIIFNVLCASNFLLRIIEEVEKNPSEKRTDVAKQLGMPPSTLNTIIAKKKMREHAYICGPGACNMWCAVCGRNVW
jgi:hypothetical protein